MAKDLAQRVAQRADAQRNGGTEVVESQSIEQYIRSMEAQFALAMPRGVEAAQLVRDAITAVRRNSKLAGCERSSVLGGLMTCAQLGLRVGVLGHAWLLPFWNSQRQRFEAQLVIGYQGYKELAYRSGLITSLIARTVYEHDDFDVDYGLADSLVHKPTIKGERGTPIAYYAIGKTSTGGHAFVVVGREEMEKHRDRHAMARNKQGQVVGPWRDNFDEMAEKTTFLQLSRWLPRSTELASAIEADGSVRLDLTPTADVAQVSQVIEGELAETEVPAEQIAGAASTGSDTGTASGEPDGELVSDGQLRRLHTALSKAGRTKRADRLAFVGEVVGRDDLESTRDLTVDQAAAVMVRLEQDASGEAPQEPTAGEGEGEPAPDPAPADDRSTVDPVDDERSRLLTAIGKAGTALGLSIEDIRRRMQRDYRTDVDHADLSDLSDLLESLTSADGPEGPEGPK